MVEIPEHLLKRSREAIARAKTAKGEPAEEAPVEEAPAEEAPAEEAPVEEAPAEAAAPEQAAPAEPTPEHPGEEGSEPTPSAVPTAQGAIPGATTRPEAAPLAEVAPPAPPYPPAAAVASADAGLAGATGGLFPTADVAAAGGYHPEDLVESAGGIKEVASSKAPGWLVLAFVIIPIVSMLYLTQFSHGVQCGQAGTLQVGSDGQLQTCDGKPLPSPGAGGSKKQGPDGAQIFAQRCAACHGPNGEGGVGMPLNKNNGTTLLKDFPTAAAQVEFVSKGNQAFPQGWGANANPPRGVMPAFGNTLSPEEIQAVVQFERSLAGEAAPGGS